MMPWLAIAYEGAGVRDSAAALFTRFVTSPRFERSDIDAMFLPLALRRLQARAYEQESKR